MEEIEKIHEGRFSASKLGCPRAQALHILGYKAVFPKKLLTKFEEGTEHDEEMKKEAEEEFEDYSLPGTCILKLARGETTAEISLTPDGLRENEVIEFKGLAASFWNSLRTEEDIKTLSILTKKYYNQVQAYAGAFKKKIIRFRIKNKKNLKVKDIVFKADPRIWIEIKNTIMDIQELLDKKELPARSCSPKEEKGCFYRASCRKELAEEVELIPKKALSIATKSQLTLHTEKYLELGIEIDKLQLGKDNLLVLIKGTMKSHGQREQELVPGTIKYGVRYKEQKNKEDIAELVEAGKIRVEQNPEEYCAVYPRGKEE
jgi:hypothetical protein